MAQRFNNKTCATTRSSFVVLKFPGAVTKHPSEWASALSPVQFVPTGAMPQVKIVPGAPTTPMMDVSSKTPGSCSFTGLVKNNGNPWPNATVGLYDRKSLRLIGKAVTDSAGAFSFLKLEGGKDDYFLVALDPNATLTYNALIFDRFAPT